MNANSSMEYIGWGTSIKIENDSLQIAQINPDETIDVVLLHRDQWDSILRFVHKFNYTLTTTGGNA